MIRVEFTADEFANVMNAVEHHLDYLESRDGKNDYDPADDLPEIIESTKAALSKLSEAGYDAFG